MSAPSWLMRSEPAHSPCEPAGKRRKGSFVEKTVGGTSELMRRAIFNEDAARQPGLLQHLDPRTKIVTLFGLLVVAAFITQIPMLLAMYAGTLALAVASRLSISFFVKRVWLFIPIFTLVIVLPAAFSFVTPGRVVVPLWTWNGHAAGLTAQGLQSAGLIVCRVTVSISLVVLLTFSTRWMDLLAGLRALRLPSILVLIVGMAYRYLFLLLNSVTDMYLARRARSVGNERKDTAGGRRFVAASAGALFGKASALSEEVHQAMVARGYSGDPRTLRAFRLRTADGLFALGAAATTVLVIGGGRLLGE